MAWMNVQQVISVDREQEYLEECWQDLKAVCVQYPDDEDLQGIHAWRVFLAIKDKVRAEHDG